MSMQFEPLNKNEPLPKILLVDDDEEIRGILKQALETEGFDVQTANSGIAAKDLVGLHYYKAVISDIKMPGTFSGLDLLEHIQSSYPKLPVVLMSGLSIHTKEAINLGAKAFLAKPFKRDELIAILKSDCQIQPGINPVSGGKTRKAEIQIFLKEITTLVETAENTLSVAESKIDRDRGAFLILSKKMLALQGTANLLGLPEIARIADLSEKIAEQAVTVELGGHIRKCVGSLWDALTTVKYILKHNGEETLDEQNILINRLLSTLRSLEGQEATL